MRNVKINETGHIVVKNLSAWWIPEIKVEREIHGTVYTVNDNFDSDNQNSVDNDFAGIRMWFNEFYARATSRKIRAVNKAKGERGEHLTTKPPFGYIKDPANPKQ